MYSDNKLIIVSSPTYYHGDIPSLMLYDIEPDDMKIIMEVLLDSGIEMSLHLGYSAKSDREWLLNTSRQVDRTIVNLEKHDLIKGFILNYPTVSYYNNTHDIESLNINKITDPIDYILRFVHERRDSE